MAIETLGDGRSLYRCWHRGVGCKQPRRTNTGLHRAAVLAMRLLGRDERLQEAVRRQLTGVRRTEPSPEAGRRTRRRPAETLAALSERRRKLLELYYGDKITAELFSEEEQRLAGQIEAFRSEATGERAAEVEADQLSVHFEQVAAALRDLDIDSMWSEATDDERRVLVDELVEEVTVFSDHLEVKVAGAPRINVTFEEVGLKVSEIGGVGEAFDPASTPALLWGEVLLRAA